MGTHALAGIGTSGEHSAAHKGLVGLLVQIISMGSPLSCFMSSQLSVIPLIVLVLNKGVFDETLEGLYNVIKWSFDILDSGIWPSCDHLGNPFPEGSIRHVNGAERKSLQGGCKSYLTEFLGDWKFVKDALRLQQHYNTRMICVNCPATKDPWPHLCKGRCAGGGRLWLRQAGQPGPRQYSKLANSAWVTSALENHTNGRKIQWP